MRAAMTPLDAYQAYHTKQEHSPWIGPSSVNTCIRQLAYQYNDCEPVNLVDRSAADFGSTTHLGLAAIMRLMYGDDCDTEVMIDFGGPRPGTADLIVHSQKLVADWKTVGQRTFNHFLNNGVSRDYEDQVLLYMLGLGGEGWSGMVIVLSRETGVSQCKEYEVAWDRDRAEQVLAKLIERHDLLLTTVRTGDDLGGDPEARYIAAETLPREGSNPERFPCSWCSFSSRCWPQPTVEGRTPMSETVAEDVPAIRDHAAAYLQANAESKRWKDVADEHRDYLAGLDGTYQADDGTDLKVTTMGGRTMLDQEEVGAILGSMGIPVPTKTGSAWTKVSRVVPKRKAK